jgi:serine/threonine-protein kinase
MRLLEKLPGDRFGSASALADELDAFLRSEVRASPRAILVRALKDAGLTQIATPFGGVADAAPLLVRSSMRKIMLGFAGLFLLILGGAIAIQGSARERSATADEGESTLGLGASLHVVATPWADVWIDGRHVDTTPFARAIALKPGKHYVKLTHPGADSEIRTVSLVPGEVGHLQVEMRFRTTAEAGSEGE